MSFSYKTLNSTDLTLTSYIANKFWEVKNSTLSQNGVTIYIGENIPVNRNNIFDPINDIETSNEEYRRLIFESIKHLYYKNYISGSSSGQFFNSSSYFNYEQTTLTSGSMISSFKTLPTQTGSKFTGFSSYDSSIIYDNSSSLYDEVTFDPDRGGKIVVISIDKDVFGSGLNPGSVYISGSGYYLRDDGEGNLFNFNNEANYARYNSAIYNKDVYLEIINSGMPQLEYVGNIFYSHGLIVITNGDYLCAFGAPPTAVNDYFSYFNMNAPQVFDPISNDISDCGSINFNTFTTHSYNGFTFPDFTYNNGFLSITPNQKSVIPGNYKIYYTIENTSGIPSNTGSINLEITSQPLEINNIISSSVCYGVTSSLPVTFSINYGVPYYSYSLDNGSTYTGVNTLFDVTVSGSIIASSSNFIYVKDYLGDIISSSLNLWYPEIVYTASVSKSPCSGSSNGIISITGNAGLSASLNGTTYYGIPYSFTNLSSSIYTIYVKNDIDCLVSSSVTLSNASSISLIPTISHVNCYGSSTGYITLDIINPSTDYSITWKDSLNNTIGNDSFILNVPTGSYTVIVNDNISGGCQSISASYSITGSSLIQPNPTASYIDSCSNAILFNTVGGAAPYTYYVKNNSTQYIYGSTTSNILLTETGLNSGSFTTYVIDSLGCTSPTSSVTVYGRTYIYSGSVCEDI